MSQFNPSLRVDEVGGRVRLVLDGFVSADGETLQDAADELVRRMLLALMTFRTRGIEALGAVQRPDPQQVAFLWELSAIAAAGGDIRDRLLGPDSIAA